MRKLRTTQSAADIAAIVGVDRATIYRWESGKVDPPLTQWIRYVRACGKKITTEIQKIDIDKVDPSHICD